MTPSRREILQIKKVIVGDGVCAVPDALQDDNKMKYALQQMKLLHNEILLK